MARFKCDLNDVTPKGRLVEDELNQAIEESIERRVSYLEVVFGKDNGEMKKRVLRFLAQPKFKELYHRIEKDEKNFGRIFVHFKLMSNRKKIGLLGYTKITETL
jgi:hypothetical protein